MKWRTEIIEYLREHSPATPALIGMYVGGKERRSASSWAHPKIQRLIEEGVVERGQHYGHYQLAQPDGEDQHP